MIHIEMLKLRFYTLNTISKKKLSLTFPIFDRIILSKSMDIQKGILIFVDILTIIVLGFYESTKLL